MTKNLAESPPPPRHPALVREVYEFLAAMGEHKFAASLMAEDAVLVCERALSAGGGRPSLATLERFVRKRLADAARETI
jgi:hypothetical protein